MIEIPGYFYGEQSLFHSTKSCYHQRTLLTVMSLNEGVCGKGEYYG